MSDTSRDITRRAVLKGASALAAAAALAPLGALAEDAPEPWPEWWPPEEEFAQLRFICHRP